MTVLLRRAVAATAVAAALGLSAPLAVSAHALPQSSSPAEGATLQQAPRQVEITFNETPDPAHSSITVVDSSGSNVDAGPTIAVPGDPAELEVPLKPLGRGVYTVTWRTLSEVDGHIATGAFAFGVGVNPASANAHALQSVQSPPPSPLAVVARWLFFVGVLLLVGAASTCLVALRAIPGFLHRVLLGGWLVTAAGTIGVIEAQREAAGFSWADLFHGSLGGTTAARLAVLAVILAAVVAVRLRGTSAQPGLVAVGVAGAAAMWIDVGASHAGAQAPAAINELTQWLHILAGGAWLGGLAVLLLALRGQGSETRVLAVRRFSTLAGVCIVLVGASGLYRAIIEVGSWGLLVSTAFGILVLVKVGLFLVLAGLGAVNRWVNVARAAVTLRGLRRAASSEVVIGVAVLAVAAALVNVSPPVTYAAQLARATQPSSLTVSGSDFATTVRVRLTVAPGTAGFDTFTLRVSDFDSGAPVNASGVTLEFTQPLRPQLGESTLALKRQGPGVFQARGANLALSGIWEVDVLVENGLSSTEVHLQVTTIEPAPQVQAVSAGGGLPTTYTVQLGSGRSVQVYLDPDRLGADEFHVTFFTQNGNSELAISQLTLGMTVPGGSPRILVTRRLDPIGHFVADVTVPKGKTRYDILATTSAGQSIVTYVVIAPGS